MLGLSLASPSNTAIFNPSSLLTKNNLKSSFHGIRVKNVSLPKMPSFSSSSSSSKSSSVVMMSKREEELKEIRSKSTEQINDEIIDIKGELLMLRLQKSAREEFKSSDFRKMRKRVARMLTVRRERELEEGIKKRLSRKLDKQWKKSIVVRPPPSLRKMQEEERAAEAAEAEKAT
ncbi:hypothetical protein C5167_017562 [Papaver somniferum]|uniref:Large ribosomal subunit protein uL29c n=1 Tax=Papaver somniferum TaxID=3469 RepID=A0A4Y7ILZ0_PAPSO|nr:50S ribosomal protein L29, chloroplastic-like [Papaver somniferum]RZC49136.1 hypothetical protein C5167_017562 [Papaver somniferum]